MWHTTDFVPAAEQAYVTLMMGIVGRALVASSETDPEIRGDLAAYPEGFCIQMTVDPGGTAFTVRCAGGGRVELVADDSAPVDLRVHFKHRTHAFLVLSFQEGSARAFANNRIYVDGDVSHAIRLLRCLSRMETLILPKLIAEHAVKHYPVLPLSDKVPLAARIYEHFVLNLVKGASA